VTAAGRWRDESPEELDELRTAVRQWRDENPKGTEDEMVAALGRIFRADYEPVLRTVLFRLDLPDVDVTAGITIITGEEGR
jgi:hypothetical protein